MSLADDYLRMRAGLAPEERSQAPRRAKDTRPVRAEVASHARYVSGAPARLQDVALQDVSRVSYRPEEPLEPQSPARSVPADAPAGAIQNFDADRAWEESGAQLGHPSWWPEHWNGLEAADEAQPTYAARGNAEFDALREDTRQSEARRRTGVFDRAPQIINRPLALGRDAIEAVSDAGAILRAGGRPDEDVNDRMRERRRTTGDIVSGIPNLGRAIAGAIPLTGEGMETGAQRSEREADERADIGRQDRLVRSFIAQRGEELGPDEGLSPEIVAEVQRNYNRFDQQALRFIDETFGYAADDRSREGEYAYLALRDEAEAARARGDEATARDLTEQARTAAAAQGLDAGMSALEAVPGVGAIDLVTHGAIAPIRATARQAARGLGSVDPVPRAVRDIAEIAAPERQLPDALLSPAMRDSLESAALGRTRAADAEGPLTRDARGATRPLLAGGAIGATAPAMVDGDYDDQFDPAAAALLGVSGALAARQAQGAIARLGQREPVLQARAADEPFDPLNPQTRTYHPADRTEVFVEPDGRVVLKYEGGYQSGGGSPREAVRTMRGALGAIEEDIAATGRSSYHWTPGPDDAPDARLADFYREAFRTRTPEGYAFSEGADGTMRLDRAVNYGDELDVRTGQIRPAERFDVDAPDAPEQTFRGQGYLGAAPVALGAGGGAGAAMLLAPDDAEASSGDPMSDPNWAMAALGAIGGGALGRRAGRERMVAAIRDPETGRVFTGANHFEALDSAPAEIQGRLEAAYAENGADVGFLRGDDFLTRDQALADLGERASGDVPLRTEKPSAPVRNEAEPRTRRIRPLSTYNVGPLNTLIDEAEKLAAQHGGRLPRGYPEVISAAMHAAGRPMAPGSVKANLIYMRGDHFDGAYQRRARAIAGAPSGPENINEAFVRSMVDDAERAGRPFPRPADVLEMLNDHRRDMGMGPSTYDSVNVTMSNLRAQRGRGGTFGRSRANSSDPLDGFALPLAIGAGGGALLLGAGEADAQETLPEGFIERDGLTIDTRSEMPSFRLAVGPPTVSGPYIIQEFSNGERHAFYVDRESGNPSPQHLGEVGRPGDWPLPDDYGRSWRPYDEDDEPDVASREDAPSPASAEEDHDATLGETLQQWRVPLSIATGMGVRGAIGRSMRAVPREMAGMTAAAGTSYAIDPERPGEAFALGAINPVGGRFWDYVMRESDSVADVVAQRTDDRGRGRIRGIEFDHRYRAPDISNVRDTERASEGIAIQQNMARQSGEETRRRAASMTPPQETRFPAGPFDPETGKPLFGSPRRERAKPQRAPLEERATEHGAAGALQGVPAATLRRIADDLGVESQGVQARALRQSLVRNLGRRFDSTRELVAFLTRYGVSAAALGVLAKGASDSGQGGA